MLVSPLFVDSLPALSQAAPAGDFAWEFAWPLRSMSPTDLLLRVAGTQKFGQSRAGFPSWALREPVVSVNLGAMRPRHRADTTAVATSESLADHVTPPPGGKLQVQRR